ncbi:MAG TPA: alkaline phosphatase PafA [Edaphocola sp.]|nr:alkaline phosphatase PafA [Edaphocola sp.]
MKKLFAFSLLFFSSFLTFGQVERPKLVVGIVLDQMRWDYLYRYAERFGNDGFKRLMNDGFNCQQTYINYLPTYTAPGHATIYTGSVPALHGIAANDWIENETKMYCTEDNAVSPVGGSEKAGKMSPKNLLATTITDELKLATNFKSKVIGISVKDRGSILPGGHTADAAYWFDASNGHFISSTFYMESLPSWVQQFNKRNITDSLLKIDWTTLFPIDSYMQSTADNNRYEGNLKGAATPTFPHKLNQYIEKDKGMIRTTPWGNTITRMIAESAIKEERLGKGLFTDFLAVSFSATDYIGHYFAPNSIEVEDCYLRMDKELAAFLNFLDKEIGKGEYTVFLTADHGGAHNVGFLEDHKIPGKTINAKQINKGLSQIIKSTYGVDSLVRFTNYQIYLNNEKIKKSKINRNEIVQLINDFLMDRDDVEMVMDMNNLNGTSIPSVLKEMSINGYNHKRSGEILVIFKPGYYSGYGQTGTTHGSWNPYDTHIPLLFYGWGVKKGSSFKTYYMTDIAPTIAALLHIQVPNACIGNVIEEVLK